MRSVGPIRPSWLVVLALVGVALATASDAKADPPAPFVVTTNARAAVRVQISEGLTMPCDSSRNRMLFDGWVEPGSSLQGSIASACVCVRNTADAFPRSGWSESRLACRPCRGRLCRPPPDPTIRVVLDASR